MPVDNRQVEQMMAALTSPGRGSHYGQQMSQRPAAGTIRGISNAPSIRSGRGGNPYDPANRMPDYAGRGWGRGPSMGTGEVGGRFSGLSAGQEMELQQNGYTDIGDIRYVLDRTTGQVTQSPRPGSDAWRAYSTGAAVPNPYGSPMTLEDEMDLQRDIRLLRGATGIHPGVGGPGSIFRREK